MQNIRERRVFSSSATPFLKSLDLDLNVEDKLSRLLKRIETGNNDVYITPIAKEHGADKLFSDFNKVFNANRSKLNDTLLELEESNKSKFGPRSIATPWNIRKQSLLESFNASRSDGFFKIKEDIQQSRLRPISLDKAMNLLKNDTSSGLPYFTRKGTVKERVLLKFDELLKRKDPCILFTRTQEQGKTRNVWGYPMADTLNEMLFYSPLLLHQQRLSYRSAICSPEMVSRRMTSLILEAVNRKAVIVSIDFKAFDNTLRSQAQKVAFNYIKSLFQSRYSKDIDYIAERFGNIGIITPDGIMSGEHGVPSGSTFTNEVDSICQYKIATTLPYVDESNIQIQGDDGVYLVPKDKASELFDTFRSCGLIVNEDKSYVSGNYAIYLQNLYHIDYLNNGIIGGIYPVYRALNRLIYQERWSDFEDYGIKGKDYYSIRTICILENCKYHPLFKQLVQFVLKYDKYSLDVSDQGISDYVQMIRKTKGAGEILNHQYGDNVSGIRSFETFKMVKGLS